MLSRIPVWRSSYAITCRIMTLWRSRQVTASDAIRRHYSEDTGEHLQLEDAELDWDYLIHSDAGEIEENIRNRKTKTSDISLQQIRGLYERLKGLDIETQEYRDTCTQLLNKACDIPNRTHPCAPIGDESEARLAETHGEKGKFNFKPKSVVQLGLNLGLLRMNHLGDYTGPRSYYFMGTLAKLERALIQFTINKLLDKGFTLVSVPDLIDAQIIEGCGFKTTGERTQVFKLQPKYGGKACLAGTAEMSLAAYFMHQDLVEDDLPQRIAAVSRCYRAESGTVTQEKGIYRVHQFTKVEMFGVATNVANSDDLLEEYIAIQKELFSEVGLHFQVLDMPTQELGAPAYRKFDIETWMRHKRFYGEISSASNCTDYQSRRLHIKYKSNEGSMKYVHTVNGTACAVPRMMMAILESNQNKDGSINIPRALQPYMSGCTVIDKPIRSIRSEWIRYMKK